VRKREPRYRGRFPEDDDADRLGLVSFAVAIPLIGIATLLGIFGSGYLFGPWLVYLTVFAAVATVLGWRYTRRAERRRRREQDAAQLLRATKTIKDLEDPPGSGGPGARASSRSS
jgi:membrane protein implicated in regulation of membrane protease activity